MHRWWCQYNELYVYSYTYTYRRREKKSDKTGRNIRVTPRVGFAKYSENKRKIGKINNSTAERIDGGGVERGGEYGEEEATTKRSREYRPHCYNVPRLHEYGYCM